jgi:hypothetical protein
MQHVAMRSDEVAIVSRVEQEERHRGHISVSKLECHSPLKGLAIARARLRFDPVAPVGTVDDGIPSATIAGRRKRHLGHEPKGSMDALPKSIQKPNMRSVPKRFPTRVDAHAEFEPNRCKHRRCLENGDRSRFPPLDAAVLRWRQADGPSHGLTLEATVQASVPEVLEKRRGQGPAASRSDVHRTFPATHGASLMKTPYVTVCRDRNAQRSGVKPIGSA